MPYATWCLPLALLAACGEATQPPPEAPPALLPDPPTLVAIVYRNTHRSGTGPSVGHYEQDELWIGPVGSTAADAGLVVTSGSPVLRRAGTELVPITGAAIPVGSRIEAWWDVGSGAHGSVQAPPGAPAYLALQVIVPPQ